MTDRFNIPEKVFSWKWQDYELRIIPRWIKVRDMTRPLVDDKAAVAE